MVGAFFVHHEADVPPWRGNAEQVGRRYECGTVVIVMLIIMMPPPPLLQLVGVFDEAMLKKTGAARRGGGQGEGTCAPKPQQQYKAGGESGRQHLGASSSILNQIEGPGSAGRYQKAMYPFLAFVLPPSLMLAHSHITLLLCLWSCLLTMIARRVLVLVCLILAVAPLQSVSGQEGGVAEAEKIDLDEVLDSLADAGVAEVS